MSESVRREAERLLERAATAETQRQEQQGLGRPIISEEFQGYRFVAVGTGLHYSNKWRTFHDFLLSYLASALGKEWGDTQLALPIGQRHAIAQWYHHFCTYQQEQTDPEREIQTAPMIGAVAAWLHLAYDVYSLEHNAELREKLLHRLKHPDQFPGARHEIFAAASLIRAGFDIEFENEDDRSSTHCEFTATHRSSGRKYSVEAKRRTPSPSDSRGLRLGRPLQSALTKKAAHPRIVFIEATLPFVNDDDAKSNMARALRDIRRCEGRWIKNAPLPPAYVVVSSSPDEHDLLGLSKKHCYMFEGFQISNFKMDRKFGSIREAYNARAAHPDIHDLIASIRQHSKVPTTFDGSPEALAFGEHPPRLLIGEKYYVPDGAAEVEAELSDVVSDPETGAVHAIFVTADGRSLLVRDQLTDAEMIAYRQHPTTFFGVRRQPDTPAKSPLDLFDFFYRVYRTSSREKLLELLAGAPDIHALRDETTEELAFIFCERCVHAAWRR